MAEQAGWQVSTVAPRADLESALFDGVLIEAPLRPTSTLPDPEADRLIRAAGALCDLLIKQNWVARVTYWPSSKEKERQPNTVRVLVGLKPSPFFDSVSSKRMREFSREETEQANKPLQEGIAAWRENQKTFEAYRTRMAAAEAGSAADLQFLIDQVDENPSAEVRWGTKTIVWALGAHFEQEIERGGRTNSQGFAGNFPDAKQMIETINKQDASPFARAIAFHDMRILTKWDVQTFDVRSANRWCEEHKCDQTVPRTP